MATAAHGVSFPDLQAEKSQKAFRSILPSIKDNFQETDFAI